MDATSTIYCDQLNNTLRSFFVLPNLSSIESIFFSKHNWVVDDETALYTVFSWDEVNNEGPDFNNLSNSKHIGFWLNFMSGGIEVFLRVSDFSISYNSHNVALFML